MLLPVRIPPQVEKTTNNKQYFLSIEQLLQVIKKRDLPDGKYIMSLQRQSSHYVVVHVK